MVEKCPLTPLSYINTTDALTTGHGENVKIRDACYVHWKKVFIRKENPQYCKLHLKYTIAYMHSYPYQWRSHGGELPFHPIPFFLIFIITVKYFIITKSLPYRHGSTTVSMKLLD
jgi:hypothetical protein